MGCKQEAQSMGINPMFITIAPALPLPHGADQPTWNKQTLIPDPFRFPAGAKKN